ncbi:MAG: zinc ribbon domain-containing protein [Bellilinea sp.]
MSQSFHLFQLQKVDTRLDQIQQRINSILLEIENDARLQNAREQHHQAGEKLIQIQRELRKIEHEVENRRLKLEQSEANLYSGRIKVPKELQDLQNEVAFLKRSIAGLEDQQLEIMIQLEEAKNEYDQMQKFLLQVEAEVSQSQAGLMGEKTRLENDQQRLMIEKQAIISQISPHILAEYEKLRQKKQGIAVASVEDSSCSACGAGLTPAQCQSARSPSTIFYCPSCGRIIYAG